MRDIYEYVRANAKKRTSTLYTHCYYYCWYSLRLIVTQCMEVQVQRWLYGLTHTHRSVFIIIIIIIEKFLLHKFVAVTTSELRSNEERKINTNTYKIRIETKERVQLKHGTMRTNIFVYIYNSKFRYAQQRALFENYYFYITYHQYYYDQI